jgi:hypothetical protein
MSSCDNVMEQAFLFLAVFFISSVPTALYASLYAEDHELYLVSLVIGGSSLSTMLNYALIRIGRVSNYHPNKYGPEECAHRSESGLSGGQCGCGRRLADGAHVDSKRLLELAP